MKKSFSSKMKRFFSNKEYKWYRPEYKRIFNVCIFSILPLWLLIIALAYLTKITGQDPELWFEPLAMLILAISFASAAIAGVLSAAIAGVLKLVDQHEKKLAKGKTEPQSSSKGR